jgi:uncharacterized membrane protein YcjF (UPF0283 family)
MSAIARICPSDWWLVIGFFTVLLMLGILLRWRHSQLMRQARLKAERAAHDSAANALQESMLQSGHGMVLRFEAIARRLPPDHPIRRDISAALDRAEAALEKWQNRAQNLRDDVGGPRGSDSSKAP